MTVTSEPALPLTRPLLPSMLCALNHIILDIISQIFMMPSNADRSLSPMSKEFANLLADHSVDTRTTVTEMSWRSGDSAATSVSPPRISHKQNTTTSAGVDTDDSIDESVGMSHRLVEYFVMVSCVQMKGKDLESANAAAMRARRAPDPTDKSMNPRTKGRFDVRRVHLPTTKSTPTTDIDDNLSVLLEPKITARYPSQDHPDRPLNPRLPQFCHPEGTELIRPTSEYKMPRVHHFVLTDSMGGKLYGTALTVYEEFKPQEEDAADDVKLLLQGGKKKTYYAPRVLTLLSTYPYLSAFRTYLTQLYRLATTTNVMTTPIERYVQNICAEVPAPPPGAFEVELAVHPSLGKAGVVRFWAPPADLPIPYVSLPLRVLFECLDVGNVLFAWYSLACEGKVLLVSSQLSLLTVCGEILCSLLFPMRWSHLYIPVLPRSLCPMLDAPMPYLCGISRANFTYAVEDISDETIVIDLDRNTVTQGPNSPALPPLPDKRRKKVESALKEHVGDIFWNARNLKKSDVLRAKASSNEAALNEMLSKAHAVWEEKIRTCDDAFVLSHAPDSATLGGDEDANAKVDDKKQSRWDAVQEAFLRFYVDLLQDYRAFLPAEEIMEKRSNWRGGDRLCFKKEEFVAKAEKDFQPFLASLVQTQQFDDFVTRKMHNAADAADIKFFDQSIDAKRNRSRLTMKKKETNFLHAASARRDLKKIKAVEPSGEGLKLGTFMYTYKMWPVTFETDLFGTPRPIPSIISAEFDRRSSLRTMLRSKYGGAIEGSQLGGKNRSPEVTAFILFFATFTSVIGKELAAVEAKHGGGTRQSLTNHDDDTEVARTIAKAQIDLAYRTLSRMRTRKLPPEPLVYKLLIQACGRVKMNHCAAGLMEMIAKDGLAADSVIYTELIKAFSNDDSQPSSLALYKMISADTMSTLSNELLGDSNRSGTSSEYRSLPSRSTASESSFDLSSEVTPSRNPKKGRSFHVSMASGHRSMLTSAKKTGSSPKVSKSKVHVSVAVTIELAESLLESLYPDVKIDTDNACPKCAAILKEEDICSGWVPCASNDYECKCLSCSHRFVPKFSVTCKSASFEGSQGKNTPLYCDQLSPWVLVREIRSIMATTGGIDHILAEEFRSGTDISSTLWWNMIVTFRRYKIPFIFLLQGSFHNNLILSSPVMLED